MDQVLERRGAETIPPVEATLNYIVNTGEKIFTEAAAAARPTSAAARSIRTRS